MPIQDIKYFLTKDESVLTKHGIRRVESIRRLLPSIDDYTAITIPGPNQTQIYAMVTKKDVPLIQQLERVIKRRKKTIETITREREEALPLLDRSTSSWQQCFNSILGANTPAENIVVSLTETYTPDELTRLNRLRHWLAPEERRRRIKVRKALEIIPDQVKNPIDTMAFDPAANNDTLLDDFADPSHAEPAKDDEVPF
jgi:hypothetical protein